MQWRRKSLTPYWECTIRRRFFFKIFSIHFFTESFPVVLLFLILFLWFFLLLMLLLSTLSMHIYTIPFKICTAQIHTQNCVCMYLCQSERAQLWNLFFWERRFKIWPFSHSRQKKIFFLRMQHRKNNKNINNSIENFYEWIFFTTNISFIKKRKRRRKESIRLERVSEMDEKRMNDVHSGLNKAERYR